ncbi:MAG: threonine--tRNA ligase [Candidatus Levybacteria bacterium]|nr:threonine--tRNA ligase [Candidatus Levybacteria bacterium]
MSNEEYLKELRHSAAHLLAAAVLKLYPNTKLTIGPAIDTGFYYDLDFTHPLTEDDLPKIEKEMAATLKTWETFSHREVTEKEAKEFYKNNEYKRELIDEIVAKGEKLTFYKAGDFEDLCRGGHSAKPQKDIGAFKLLSIAGAYWRGSEKNKMLTRIYGTAYPKQKELENHLTMLEEAKKRDHRKLGRELDLFHFQPEAPGMPFWHPKGMILRNELLAFSRKLQLEYGYKEVLTPTMMDVSIFKQSGHWDHYQKDMFSTIYEDDKLFGLKPMNCPGMIQVYKSSLRSYRDLPLRLSEYGLITRKEQSGELNGMFRVMQATQDDAHLFVTEDAIDEALEGLIALVSDIYAGFGLKFKAYLSTRPDNYMGKLETWDRAEKTLKAAMEKAGLEILLKEKDGAFYGPKIDYQLEDSLGRTWQCGTLQLDFQMPETFNIEYIDSDGTAKRPVIIHRTIIGSVERFIGILTEHYAGAFPVWLAPVQVVLLPIADRHIEFGQKVIDQLQNAGIRAEMDTRSERLQAKIRDATLQKVPFMGIIGDKEIVESAISVRKRDGEDLGQIKTASFLNLIQENIAKKT